MKIDGNDLINMGFEPGPLFPAMILFAESQTFFGSDDLGHLKVELMAQESFKPVPEIELRDAASARELVSFNIEADAGNDYDVKNMLNVSQIMYELMKTPVAVNAAVLPDACPTGPKSMPVGTVVSSKHIHPGWHSADICCSLYMTLYDGAHPQVLLDAASSVVHFGPGGPDIHRMPDCMLQDFMGNSFLNDPSMIEMAHKHLGSSGDGNHFVSVGTSSKTGVRAIVSHSGSRGPGARLYKKGMKLAQYNTRKISPKTYKGNAWIDSESPEGIEYWEALQIIREWTKLNHELIHQAIFDVADIPKIGAAPEPIWNEHNFVFKRDGLFFHAKGATPAFADWSLDAQKVTIIPLNAVEPILIVRGSDNPKSLGFSPHGAGRLISRSQHKLDLVSKCEGSMHHMNLESIIAEETANIDMRFYSGDPDVTELPSAYKNADAIISQIEQFGLAEIVDTIYPYGCIMGGVFDWKSWGKKQTEDPAKFSEVRDQMILPGIASE